MVSVAGAVLAAGSGTRMGGPKAELVVDGARLLDRAIGALRDGGCEPVLAVVRAGTYATDVTTVVNPDPARGMRSSLALAVEAAAEADALAVILVDMPGVSADAISTVIEAWRPGRIARARFGQRPGHPIVMGLELWREAVRLAEPDGGARVLINSRPELVDDVHVTGDPADLDTPQDLARHHQL